MHVAAFCGRTACLELMLKMGGNAGAEDEDRKTPLDLAREQHESEAVALLVAWLASPEADAVAQKAQRRAQMNAARTRATALGLLMPLRDLALDAQSMDAATLAAVAFCDGVRSAGAVDTEPLGTPRRAATPDEREGANGAVPDGSATGQLARAGVGAGTATRRQRGRDSRQRGWLWRDVWRIRRRGRRRRR